MTPRRLSPIVAALLFASLSGCDSSTSKAADPKPTSTTSAASAAPGAAGGTPVAAAIAKIPTGTEQRDGYKRTAFKHWVDADDNQCDTRDEVLIAEAVKAPTQGEDCALTGGAWRSYYDGKTVTDASTLDIDHMIALAEAWDSGAAQWTTERREAYANDLDAERTLVAVTARTNRSKGDQDPAEWLPPLVSARCTYLADWTATKLRWGLTADTKERTALRKLAADCPDTTVAYKPAA